MIDRAALLEKLRSFPDSIACAAHPEETARAFCGACRQPFCRSCLRLLPEGARCPSCAALPAARSSPARRLTRWLRTPAGGSLAAILALTAVVTAFRDRDLPRRATTPGRETPAWQAAMMRLEKAARLRDQAGMFASRGFEAEASRLSSRAAGHYRAFIDVYPDDEKVADRRYAVPRARLAAAACAGGREEIEALERLLGEDHGDAVEILAGLRWASAVPPGAGEEVRSRLEKTLTLLEAQKGAIERLAEAHAHSQAEELKRLAIAELTGTRFTARDSRAEAHFRLGEWHAARGRREEALEYLGRAVDSDAWGPAAMDRIRELQSPGDTPRPEEFKIERLGK